MLKTSLIAARSQKHAKITVIRAACRSSVSSMYTAEVIQSFEPTRIGAPRDSRASSRFFFTETRHLAAKHVPTCKTKLSLIVAPGPHTIKKLRVSVPIVLGQCFLSFWLLCFLPRLGCEVPAFPGIHFFLSRARWLGQGPK